MENLGAWGKMIYEKNLKSKISCQTPFKGAQAWDIRLQVYYTIKAYLSRRLQNWKKFFFIPRVGCIFGENRI
jgi:hypothetical protein